MIDRILLVRRQSPDWEGLSRDYRAGSPIALDRYVPQTQIPGFPPNIEQLIRQWNTIFQIDFFTCRAAMKSIADFNNRKAVRVSHLDFTDHEAILAIAASQDVLAFFHDDDDIFDIDIVVALQDIDPTAFDVAVFPLFRLNQDLFTFVRKGSHTTVRMGRQQDFGFRYQTNNYGLSSRGISRERLVAMKDHVEASAYADSAGLVDLIFESPISATIKSPASASYLPRIADPDLRNVDFSGFVSRLETALPVTVQWLKEPMRRTIRLFALIASNGTYDDLIQAGLLQS